MKNPLSSPHQQRGIVRALELLLRDGPPLTPRHRVADRVSAAFDELAPHLPPEKQAKLAAGEEFEHVWDDTDVEDWPVPDPDHASGYTMAYYHLGVGQDAGGRYLVGDGGVGYTDVGERWVEWDWDTDPELCYLPGSDYYDGAEAQAFLAEVWDPGDAFFYGWARYYVDCARRFLAGESAEDADPLAASYWMSDRTLTGAEDALEHALDSIGYLFSDLSGKVPA